MRVRIRYSKLGRVRFVSGRDVASLWERALRRAELPIAYSQGFTPHPKVSFPDALSVGFESTGEYAELTFSEPVDVDRDLPGLSEQLPDGMDIQSWSPVFAGAPKLASELEVGLWDIEFPAMSLRQEKELARRVHVALNMRRWDVTRVRPSGESTIDLRESLLAAHVLAQHEDVPTTIRAVLRNVSPAIRPVDLVNALQTLEPDPDTPGTRGLPAPDRYRRVVQGRWNLGAVIEAITHEVIRFEPALRGAA